MDFNIRTVVLLVLCLTITQIQSDSSINQNINQAIKGASGPVNQIISQDIKNNEPTNEAINQNIKQDIEACQGGSSGSINQNIQQKVARGSCLIDQKTVKQIKKSCGDEFIIKRHRSNCGCKDRDSSEEIKVCDGKHTSEIIIKNHESNCKDLKENNSDEISVKFDCGKNEEVVVKRPKDELDIRTWIRPSNCQFKDVSSEEQAPCPCKRKDESCSSEEHVIEDSQDDDSFESKPKLPPCKCKERLESSEELDGYAKGSCSSSESESEESPEILKPCNKHKVVIKPSSDESDVSEDVSASCDRWAWIRPKLVKRPVSSCKCNKRPCGSGRKCPSCKQETSDEQQAIFY